MYLHIVVMYIYLILFFLLYLIGRYLFLSIPLIEGNKEETRKKVGLQLNEGVEVEDEVVDVNDSDYGVPSMKTILDQLQELQRQSLSQAGQITDLNTRVNTLLTGLYK